MHVPIYFLAESDLLYVWDKSTIEGKAIIFVLMFLSVFARRIWSAFPAITDQAKMDKNMSTKMIALPSIVALSHT